MEWKIDMQQFFTWFLILFVKRLMVKSHWNATMSAALLYLAVGISNIISGAWVASFQNVMSQPFFCSSSVRVNWYISEPRGTQIGSKRFLKLFFFCLSVCLSHSNIYIKTEPLGGKRWEVSPVPEKATVLVVFDGYGLKHSLWSWSLLSHW